MIYNNLMFCEVLINIQKVIFFSFFSNVNEKDLFLIKIFYKYLFKNKR